MDADEHGLRSWLLPQWPSLGNGACWPCVPTIRDAANLGVHATGSCLFLVRALFWMERRSVRDRTAVWLSRICHA